MSYSWSHMKLAEGRHYVGLPDGAGDLVGGFIVPSAADAERAVEILEAYRARLDVGMAQLPDTPASVEAKVQRALELSRRFERAVSHNR